MGGASLDRLGTGKASAGHQLPQKRHPGRHPRWVGRDGDALGVWTAADSWKVKRIRARADVLVGPCDLRGNSTGDQVPVTAEICDAATTARHRQLIARKYGIIGRLSFVGSRLRRGQAGTLGIRVTPTP
jgi:PPOX class probable F420-dependent enzyme